MPHQWTVLFASRFAQRTEPDCFRKTDSVGGLSGSTEKNDGLTQDLSQSISLKRSTPSLVAMVRGDTQEIQRVDLLNPAVSRAQRIRSDSELHHQC